MWPSIISAVLVVIALLWWMARRSARRQIEQLQEFQEAFESSEAISELLAAGGESQEKAITRGEDADAAELALIVEEFLGPAGDPAYFAAQSLKAAGDRALPALRHAFSDPRLGRRYDQDGIFPVGQMPADDLVEILEDDLDDETIDALIAALDHQEGNARGFLLVLLARAGAPGALPALRDVLAQPAEAFELRFLLCNALSDLSPPPPEYRELAPLLAGPDEGYDALAAALRLDREAVLARRDVGSALALDDELIPAAAQTKTTLPRALLKDALADIDAFLDGKRDAFDTSASALIVDALDPDAATEARLERALVADDEVLVYCARTALLIMDRLPPYWGVVEPYSDEDGPLEMLAVRAARELAGLADDEGFAAYLESCQAVDPDRALVGLELIGAHAHLAIAHEALRDVPREASSDGRLQYDPGEHADFASLDTRWQALNGPRISVLAFRFVRDFER